ncbi:hypothetical protein MRX96_021591 [Rhipicephalus microplus]
MVMRSDVKDAMDAMSENMRLTNESMMRRNAKLDMLNTPARVPPPEKKLPRSLAVTLRLLQTNSYHSPWRMKHINPDYDGQHV